MEKKHINELKANAAVILEKLEEARQTIEDEPLTMEYDNGGGQTGVRENPFFPAYEKLLKTYQSILTQLESATGESLAEQKKAPVIAISKWKRAGND